MILSVSRRSF